MLIQPICANCGNDDAAYDVCADCIGVNVEAVAATIANCLGGEPDDYRWIAEWIERDQLEPGASNRVTA